MSIITSSRVEINESTVKVTTFVRSSPEDGVDLIGEIYNDNACCNDARDAIRQAGMYLQDHLNMVLSGVNPKEN